MYAMYLPQVFMYAAKVTAGSFSTGAATLERDIPCNKTVALLPAAYIKTLLTRTMHFEKKNKKDQVSDIL